MLDAPSFLSFQTFRHIAIGASLSLGLACAALSQASAAALPMTPAPWIEPAIELAKHSTPGATCGISSGNFARTCRPGTFDRCMGAVARNVEGFTAARCARERDACSSCLRAMHTCIGRIGHVIAKVTRSTCETCKTRFNTCLDRGTR